MAVIACVLSLGVPFISAGAGAPVYQDVAAVEALIGSRPEDWPDGPEVDSQCAIVMDADTGAILYAKNATQTHYPASTTKIMTALLAIEQGSLGDTVRFSNTAVNSLPPGSSHIAMRVGEELSLEDCLYGLLLPSANEVANALAEYTAGDISTFADMMNERAARIGTVNTHFSNPTGLHQEDHYTCAYDLALIMQTCVKNAKFRDIDRAATYVIPATNKHEETRPIGSTHGMLRTNSEYYDSRVIGGKTGWTLESGRNLITYAYDNGMYLIVVTMGAETPQQYSDTKKLMDFAFSSFTTISAAEYDETYGARSGRGNLLKLPQNQLQRFSLNENSKVTIPAGRAFEDLTRVQGTDQQGNGILTYYDQGYPVGQAVLAETDLSELDADQEGSLLSPQIRRMYHINLWYVIMGIGIMGIALSVFVLIRRTRRRTKGISFRKRRRRRW